MKVYIDELKSNKVVDIVQEAKNKLLHDRKGVTVELMAREYDCIDTYYLTLSGGVDGLKDKLVSWLDNKDYYTEELDDWEKEDYIIEQAPNFVNERTNEDVQELINDYGTDNYYMEASLTYIIDFIYDVFYNIVTPYEIDLKLEQLLGFYGSMFLVQDTDTKVFYLFLQS